MTTSKHSVLRRHRGGADVYRRDLGVNPTGRAAGAPQEELKCR